MRAGYQKGVLPSSGVDKSVLLGEIVSGKAYRIIQVTKVKPFTVTDKQLKAILLTSETSKNEIES